MRQQPNNQDGPPDRGLQTDHQALARPDAAPSLGRRIVIEKDLTALGFFTPSSSRIKRTKAKTIRFTKVADGKRIETSATIVPSALHGLPITADLDKYLALQDLLRGERQNARPITNPITFSTAAMLRALNICGNSGKNHSDVSEWLDLMSSTTIISEGAVFLAGSRRWARDRFRVFDRAITHGAQLENGSIAERNYVWLSDWQLENMNSRHVLPIDFDVYQRLQTHIARVLVPLLQIWLYASQRSGLFEKRYDELCQLLGLRRYDHRSKITEKLGPALDELAEHGYLAAWRVERTSDGRAFKLVLQHGRAFTKDPPASIAGASSTTEAAGADETPVQNHQAVESAEADTSSSEILSELTRRGISERQSRGLLSSLPPSRDVRRQLEWGDEVIARMGDTRVWNPAGLYLTLLRDNVEPPAHFLSSDDRQALEEARDVEATDRMHQADLRHRYAMYLDQQAEAHLDDMEPLERDRLLAAKAVALRAQYPQAMFWKADTLAAIARASARQELVARLHAMDFRSFVAREQLDNRTAVEPEARFAAVSNSEAVAPVAGTSI